MSTAAETEEGTAMRKQNLDGGGYLTWRVGMRARELAAPPAARAARTPPTRGLREDTPCEP